jgi:hypothetical protein
MADAVSSLASSFGEMAERAEQGSQNRSSRQLQALEAKTAGLQASLLAYQAPLLQKPLSPPPPSSSSSSMSRRASSVPRGASPGKNQAAATSKAPSAGAKAMGPRSSRESTTPLAEPEHVAPPAAAQAPQQQLLSSKEAGGGVRRASTPSGAGLALQAGDLVYFGREKSKAGNRG